MRENLSSFIRREAGPDTDRQLCLLQHLARSVFIAGGYDFDELRQLVKDGPTWTDSSGSEYVSKDWPEVPVLEPLRCIAIRPFKLTGHGGPPYELVRALAMHLRDVLEGAESPDFDDMIRFGYIEQQALASWESAAHKWRASLGVNQQHAGNSAVASIAERGNNAVRPGAKMHQDENIQKNASTDGSVDASRASSSGGGPSWTVVKPMRYRGYRLPLQRLLASANREGKPCPTARDVLEAWRTNTPHEIARVLSDGFDFYDSQGNTKAADLGSLHKAIKRMTSTR